MKFEGESIGSRLIESITFSLYDRNLNCIREYIQNSIDSGAKNIDIYFENGDQDLIIKDDGSGMSYDELKTSLYIGISDKSEKDVGWRGIGIWSGVPVSKRIVIITKARNGKKYRLEIDNKLISNEILSNKPLLDVLSEGTGDIEEKKIGNDEKDSHYTEVRLESILPTQKGNFDEGKIKEFLSGTVPAPFNDESFLFANEINRWLEQSGVVFRIANIRFQGEKIFRPPEKSDIFFETISKKEFKIGNELVAAAWIVTSKKNKVLRGSNGGVYFKKKGFTLGDKSLVHKQYAGNYSQWQYGEIHIISEEFKENTARSGFGISTPKLDKFLSMVGEFIGQLQQQNQYQSNRVISDLIARAQKYYKKENIGLAKKTLKDAKIRLSEIRSYPLDTALKDMQKAIDAESERNRQECIELYNQINKSRSLKEQKMAYLDATLKNLPPSVRIDLSKITRKGKLSLQSSLTDSLRDILKTKTGSISNEIHKLSQEAYGWDIIKEGKNPPILTIDPTFNNKNQNNPKRNRNLRFGVLIYAIHDLFINMAKHEKDNESFEWYEGATEEEKIEMASQLLGTIGLVYKMVEKSEKFKK
jgi:hypothetical protein